MMRPRVLLIDRDGDAISVIPRDPDHPIADPVLSVKSGSQSLSVFLATDDDVRHLIDGLRRYLLSEDPDANP